MKTVRILLNDNELNLAISNYINSMGITTEDREVDIRLKQGRKGNGNSATVVIKEPSSDDNKTNTYSVQLVNNEVEEENIVKPDLSDKSLQTDQLEINFD